MHKLQRTYPSQRCVFQGNDHGDLMEGEDLRVEKHKTMNNQNSMEPLRRENTAATHRVRGNKETVHPRKKNKKINQRYKKQKKTNPKPLHLNEIIFDF